MRKTLKVSLDIKATETAKVTVSEDPAFMKGKKVRWEKDPDSPVNFRFAGIMLDDESWPDQKILVDKNTIICGNNGNKDSTKKFRYLITVIYENKLYFSEYPAPDEAKPEAEGDKPVIRNQ